MGHGIPHILFSFTFVVDVRMEMKVEKFHSESCKPEPYL
jgi:hypothetical protein